MHAVHNIMNGTLVERIFWSLKLTAALGAAIYLSKELFTSYYEYEVGTKVKIETRQRLQFPMILIGHPYALLILKNSRNNCSSNQSASYDHILCTILTKDCPEFFADRISAGGTSVSCDVPDQVMVVNGDGKSYQTLSENSMNIWINSISESDLPF